MSHQANIHHTERSLKHAEQMSNTQYAKLCRLRKQTKLTVSDHSIVRYLERVMKSPLIEKAQEELITPQVKQLYQQLGDGTYPTGNGTTRVVIKDGVIVTVLM